MATFDRNATELLRASFDMEKHRSPSDETLSREDADRIVYSLYAYYETSDPHAAAILNILMNHLGTHTKPAGCSNPICW